MLESGTHAELLHDENGPYSRLVQAQRLREGTTEDQESDNNAETSAGAAGKDVSAAIDANMISDPELRLTRVESNRSLVSSKLERPGASQGAKSYSLTYLFTRMGKINRDQWPHYLTGAIASFSK